MTDFKKLSEAEVGKLSFDEQRKYYDDYRAYCLSKKQPVQPEIGQKVISLVYPLVGHSYDFDIRHQDRIPKDKNCLFVANHSSSHDIFTAYEIESTLGRKCSVMVATDCLNPVTIAIFGASDATLFSRYNSLEAQNAMDNMIKKMAHKDGLIFGESTWNINPYEAMHPLKQGAAIIVKATKSVIVPEIIEYIEVPKIVTRESDLYSKCVIDYGEPIEVSPSDNSITVMKHVQDVMSQMRRDIWEETGAFRCDGTTESIQIYLNHTYIKKFKAFGFTFDSEKESKFLVKDNGHYRDNEYYLNENGLFVPGVTNKRGR